MTAPKIRLKTPAEFEQEGWAWTDPDRCWLAPRSLGIGGYGIHEKMFSPLVCTDALLATVAALLLSPDALEYYQATTPEGKVWTWRPCLFKRLDDAAEGVAACECGADKHGFTGHMRFCPKWS